jgi:phage terminase small subunit
MKINELSPRRERFVQEYLVDQNATQAYIRTGYSEKGAAQSAGTLLRNPQVRERIRKLQEDRAKGTEANAANVVKALARIAFSDPSKLFREDGTRKPVSELTGVEREWIGIRQTDKIKALELRSRHYGLFEKDNKQSRPLEHLSDEELRAKISAFHKKMGWDIKL